MNGLPRKSWILSPWALMPATRVFGLSSKNLTLETEKLGSMRAMGTHEPSDDDAGKPMVDVSTDESLFTSQTCRDWSIRTRSRPTAKSPWVLKATA